MVCGVCFPPRNTPFLFVPVKASLVHGISPYPSFPLVDSPSSQHTNIVQYCPFLPLICLVFPFPFESKLYAIIKPEIRRCIQNAVRLLFTPSPPGGSSSTIPPIGRTTEKLRPGVRPIQRGTQPLLAGARAIRQHGRRHL